jgi:hypothetical protein
MLPKTRSGPKRDRDEDVLEASNDDRDDQEERYAAAEDRETAYAEMCEGVADGATPFFEQGVVELRQRSTADRLAAAASHRALYKALAEDVRAENAEWAGKALGLLAAEVGCMWRWVCEEADDDESEGESDSDVDSVEVEAEVSRARDAPFLDALSNTCAGMNALVRLLWTSEEWTQRGIAHIVLALVRRGRPAAAAKVLDSCITHSVPDAVAYNVFGNINRCGVYYTVRHLGEGISYRAHLVHVVELFDALVGAMQLAPCAPSVPSVHPAVLSTVVTVRDGLKAAVARLEDPSKIAAIGLRRGRGVDRQASWDTGACPSGDDVPSYCVWACMRLPNLGMKREPVWVCGGVLASHYTCVVPPRNALSAGASAGLEAEARVDAGLGTGLGTGSAVAVGVPA